jgi:hypothetical protein
MKADNPALKGIALTDYSMEDDVSRTANIRFNMPLTKPVNIMALESTLA